MNQFFKDLFQPNKAFARKREEYLSQFKKTYKERTIAENVIINSLYNLEFLCVYKNELRFLGGIETVLVLNGKLNPNEPLKDSIKKGENYRSLVIRLGKEYLKEKSIIQ